MPSAAIPPSGSDPHHVLECAPQETLTAPIESPYMARHHMESMLEIDHMEDNECSTEEKLVFLHIPKNAGTSIEDAGFASGIEWGRYMSFKGCDLGFNDCEASWHQPPARVLGSNMYTDARVFCVVRHPYSRAVSEYQYLVANPEYRRQLAGIIEEEGCSATGLNEALKLALTSYQASPANFDIHFCHMIPQAFYIWGAENDNGHRCQWCHEVIRLEEFPKAFDDLMERFGYNVSLPQHDSNRGACPDLSVADLSDEVLELLAEVYKDDLEMLNYSPDVNLTKHTNHSS